MEKLDKSSRKRNNLDQQPDVLFLVSFKSGFIYCYNNNCLR